LAPTADTLHRQPSAATSQVRRLTSVAAPFAKRRPRRCGRGLNSSTDLDLDAGTRRSDLNARLPSDLDAWLPYATALLDGYVGVSGAPTHRQVAVLMNALFAAQRAHAISVAHPVSACWHGKKGGTRHCGCRDIEVTMSCSHL
jgi:hypothetical protein